MALIKRIVCLANSRKVDGRCVAGLELGPDGRLGKWIRPLGAQPSESLTSTERCYAYYKEPRLRDIIEVGLSVHAPRGHQTENYKLEPGKRWLLVGRIPFERLCHAVEKFPGQLWWDGCSSHHGINDMVPYSHARGLSHSLHLLKPDNISLEVHVEKFSNKKKIRARLQFGSNQYLLPVTDTRIEDVYLRKNEGRYEIASVPLCLSLGKPYPEPAGPCYKLVAAFVGAD